mgnify:FL=1
MPSKQKASIHFPLFGEKRDFFSALAASGNLKHAYLFFGDEGVGKLTFASLFARFLEEGEFSESRKPLIDAEVLFPDDDGKISVDAVRTVKNFLSQRPLRSPRRTLIIRGGESLTPQAQAACLKVVEEPPSSSLIILTARAPESLFPPLASRLLKVYFPRMREAELADFLVHERGAPRERAKAVAERSYGSIGRALALLADKKRKKAEGLAGTVSEAIAALRERDVVANSSLLARLLRMQELLARYNLNERVQEKAFRYLLERR